AGEQCYEFAPLQSIGLHLSGPSGGLGFACSMLALGGPDADIRANFGIAGSLMRMTGRPRTRSLGRLLQARLFVAAERGWVQSGLQRSITAAPTADIRMRIWFGMSD